MKLLKSAQPIAMRLFSVLPMLLFFSGTLCYAEGLPTAAEIAKIRSKAEQGDSASQAQLMVLYRYGKVVNVDYKESFKWAVKSADQGHPMAQHFLGIYYTYGMGVKKDLVTAFNWFKKSADQGYANGQYRLGACYLEGDGVPRNDVLGVEWLLKAANQDDVDSKFLLGKHYLEKSVAEMENFEDIDTKLERFKNGDYSSTGAKFGENEYYEELQIISYMWYNLASADGHESAKEAVNLLSKAMKPDLISEAQRKSAEWKPKK